MQDIQTVLQPSFGLASLAAGVGVFSFHRQDPSNVAEALEWQMMDGLYRSADEENSCVDLGNTLHELGHTA